MVLQLMIDQYVLSFLSDFSFFTLKCVDFNLETMDYVEQGACRGCDWRNTDVQCHNCRVRTKKAIPFSCNGFNF